MKSKPSKFLEQHRVKEGPLASDASFGNNGAFIIPHKSYQLAMIVSDGAGWEHVSVRRAKNCGDDIPDWRTMQYVKELWWKDSETVMQIHPPKADYANRRPSVLHLWRPTDREIPRPPIESAYFLWKRSLSG